jgi:hypothetical protein
MQHNFFHFSTKERRRKVAKKEERKYTAAAAGLHKPVNFFQDASNQKLEILISKRILNLKFCSLNLFRISSLGFRIFLKDYHLFQQTFTLTELFQIICNSIDLILECMMLQMKFGEFRNKIID